MFTNYIIKDDILYLNIDINYEFGGSNSKSFIDNIKSFINEKNIKDKYSKIIITSCGIIIGSILFINGDSKIEKDNMKYVPSFKDNITFNYNLYQDDNEVLKIEEENISNTKNRVNTIENVNNNTENVTSNVPTSDSVNNNYNVTNPGVSNDVTVSIKRSNQTVENIELEEYVIGVIAAEMPASFNIEALKAQAVASRTYALKASLDGKQLTDTVSTQSYIDTNGMREKWGNSFDTYYNKIKSAVYDTKDEYLSYNNSYIDVMYHSTNNGMTESSLDVFGYYHPYLVSVSSEFDKSASSYLREVNYDINFVSSKLGTNLNNDSIFEIISYTDGGNIREIKINDKVFTGRNFRELLGLRSADFDIRIENDKVYITTRGFGHGVGMSQYGANGMANNGYSYRDILLHYYPGTTIKK